jgi:hypothetical protein
MTTAGPASQATVSVHLLDLPVPLAAEAQEHFQELLREFSLVAGDGSGSAEHVPARLLKLIDVLNRQFAGANSAAEERLEAAIASGQLVIADHVLELPEEAGPAAQSLGYMIDEADAYCRNGQHLLTLATPARTVAYRHWYLGQVVDQLAGRPAVSWPSFQPSTADVAKA